MLDTWTKFFWIQILQTLLDLGIKAQLLYTDLEEMLVADIVLANSLHEVHGVDFEYVRWLARRVVVVRVQAEHDLVFAEVACLNGLL